MRMETAGVCRQLDRLLRLGTIAGMTDSLLLETFVSGDQESATLAFRRTIVDRHGPMVFRVCRLILKDEHAAEDAVSGHFLGAGSQGRAAHVERALGQLAIRRRLQDGTKGPGDRQGFADIDLRLAGKRRG